MHPGRHAGPPGPGPGIQRPNLRNGKSTKLLRTRIGPIGNDAENPAQLRVRHCAAGTTAAKGSQSSICDTFSFQNRGRYVNHVVIQENPVIMQDTDKTVRVECAFTAEDQTVSFKPTAGEGLRGEEAGGGISVT